MVPLQLHRPMAVIYPDFVRRSSASAIVFALLLWVSTPALACIVAPAQMTPAEMQCCRDMADQCGGTAMAEHSCCAKTPAKVDTENKTVLATSETPLAIAPVLLAYPVSAVTPVQVYKAVIPSAMVAFESPPGPLPLRI